MTRDAVSLMPDEFQNFFTKHPRFSEAGIKDPDELIRDWVNHYYIPSIPEGTALDRIDQIVKAVQIKMKRSNTVDVGKQLCYLAHYVGDLWTPEYLIKQNTTPDMLFVNETAIVVFYEGFRKPIENIREYLQKRSEYRWRLENSKKISTLLYSEAVNDIAHIWLTLWQRNGNEIAPQTATVIDHESGTLNINFQRLLSHERYNWYDHYEKEEDWQDAYQSWEKEVDRLEKNVAPGDAELFARHEMRKEQLLLSQISPEAPFQFIEFSLKGVGDKSFFVARLRNKGETEIASISFMYPGIRGPIARIKNLEPGQVAKIQGFLPADATKEQIQMIFASRQ